MPRDHHKDDSDMQPKGNELCCCPPIARVWIEVVSESITVENKIEEKRHLETSSSSNARPDIHVNAAANAQPRVHARTSAVASVRAPGGPPLDADSMGATGADAPVDSKSDADAKVDTDADSKTTIDEWTRKDQGKVFRTDRYVIHWQAEGCGPMRVRLEVVGAVTQSLDWLPKTGSIRVSKNHLLEPPDYQPLDALPLSARLAVEDCMHQVVVHKAGSAVP